MEAWYGYYYSRVFGALIRKGDKRIDYRMAEATCLRKNGRRRKYWDSCPVSLMLNSQVWGRYSSLSKFNMIKLYRSSPANQLSWKKTPRSTNPGSPASRVSWAHSSWEWQKVIKNLRRTVFYFKRRQSPSVHGLYGDNGWREKKSATAKYTWPMRQNL